MSMNLAFTHFPLLTTDRLQLRQFQPEDAKAFFKLKSNQQIMDFYGDKTHTSLEETRTLIQEIRDLYTRHESIFWGITLKGEDAIIGSCAFISFGPDLHYAEIGYELNQEYWRQGIVAEALAVILTYGFTELGLHRIEAAMDQRNEASRNLLLKLGFTYEGNLRQRFFFRDQFLDAHYFGLLKHEWPRSV